jgi:hypothetical protein
MAYHSNEREKQPRVDPRSYVFFVLQCLARLEAVMGHKGKVGSPKEQIEPSTAGSPCIRRKSSILRDDLQSDFENLFP